MKRNKKVVAVVAALLTVGTSAVLACGGNACQPEQNAPLSTLSVGANAGSSGFFMSKFMGQQGYNVGEKSGYSGVDVSMQAAGNLCGGDCQSGSFATKAYAGEHAMSQTGAMGNQSGEAVYGVNATGVAAQASITVPAGFRPHPRY